MHLASPRKMHSTGSLRSQHHRKQSRSRDIHSRKMHKMCTAQVGTLTYITCTPVVQFTAVWGSGRTTIWQSQQHVHLSIWCVHLSVHLVCPCTLRPVSGAVCQATGHSTGCICNGSNTVEAAACRSCQRQQHEVPTPAICLVHMHKL
jgi:hypothetical protein